MRAARKTRHGIILGILALVLVIVAVILIVRSAARPAVTVESGSVNVTMCPACEERFLSLLRGGGDITCALYNFGDETEEALRVAGARVLTDDEDGGSYGVRVRVSGLMHNKFCVINETFVTSGSYNPTNGGSLSRNNLLVFESPTLAAAYLAEWEAIRVGGKHKRVTQQVALPEANVTVAFCPHDGCEEQLVHALDAARRSVHFMVYSFTSDAVADALERARARGVFVQGVCDRSQWNVLGGECASIGAQRWTGERLLHHKVFIIDGALVVTGSYNPTASGNSRNRENALFIESESITRQFEAEYAHIWAASAPVLND